jgi:CRISPR-associated protein Csc1
MTAALEVTLRTQGEIWYASREVGRLADTEPYFLNTALYYALGFASGRYVDYSFEPTYLDDTDGVAEELYVTPATPSDSPGAGLANRITSTYNTSSDDYATINYAATDDQNTDAKQNLPTYGRRRVLGHGNELTCYLLGRGSTVNELESQVPGYVRLGKKRGKARVETEPLDVSQGDGEFDLGHPIGAYDTALTPVGNLVTKRMRPTPLVMQASYKGAYVELGGSNPDDDGGVRIPADATFLNTKR